MALLEDIAPEQVFSIGAPFELPKLEETTLPPDSIADSEAIKIVVQDAVYTERWLEGKMLPLTWLRYDRLYQFKVPQQFWEGTNIPRANLGMPLVYEHVESILPQVITGLFADDPPFMSRPRPGTSMQAARANDQLLLWELNRVGFREQIRRMVKSALIFGMGVGKWGWRCFEKETTVKRRKSPRKFMPMGPAGGVTLDPEDSDELEDVQVIEEINEPTFDHVHVRHVLVDPSTRNSDIRTAKFVIHRLYLTLQDLNDLSDDDNYFIPPIDQMKKVFFPPKEIPIAGTIETSTIDMNTEFKALPRSMDATVDPTQQSLEVLEYWTKDRVYTVVQRKLVIRNQPNPYKRIPFVSFCLTDVLDSFYGLGVAQIIGQEQRMQQGVINSFLDDLALSLNGMFVRVRGKNTPTQQVRMRPGGIIDTDDKDGVTVMQRQPIQMEVGAVLAQSDARAERRTAANELVVQGSMPSEKSSITRTATGVNALMGGSGARLQYFIENIAGQAFVPVLEAFHMMNGKHLKPSQINKILSKELATAYAGDVVDLLNANVDFDILSAAKLQARSSYRASLPIMFQFILTEPVLTALSQEGKKINIQEMVNMLFQVTGWPNKQDVIIDMTPEDQQRMMMMQPGVQQMMAAQANTATQTQAKSKLLEQESTDRAGRDVIRSLLKQSEAPFIGATVNNGR